MLRTGPHSRGIPRVPAEQAAIGLLAVPATSSRRQSTRFPKILPKGNSATISSPFQESYVSSSQASSEDTASTTSSSRSSTPASSTDLIGLQHIISSGLSLDAESLLSSFAPYGTEDLHEVTTPERSRRRNSSSSVNHAAQHVRSDSSQLILNASQKRKYSTPNRSGGDDGDDEQDERNGRSKRKAQATSEGFPCPYWMRYQQTSLKNSCRRSKFETIPRLKEHLQRVHYNRSLCSRCFAEFADLSLHERDDPPCAINFDPCSLEFGLSQWARLHDKMRGKSDEDKWREIWSILFYGADQNNIPPPNAQDLSIYQRHDLINSLEESILSSFNDWENYLHRQAQAGFVPAADGDSDISWMITPLRSRLAEIFRGFREAHSRAAFPAADAGESAGVAANPIGGQPACSSGTHALTSFTGGGDLTQRPEQSQTINLAAVQVRHGHDQHVHAEMHYPAQHSHGGFSDEEGGALQTWYHHDENPYQGHFDGSGYDDNEG